MKNTTKPEYPNKKATIAQGKMIAQFPKTTFALNCIASTILIGVKYKSGLTNSVTKTHKIPGKRNKLKPN